MHQFQFVDVRRFRVKLPQPLFPYRGSNAIDTTTLMDAQDDLPGWARLCDLSDHFKANFSKRNALNLPGPIYGADTDTCLTGPHEAPNNVMVDQDGREFVFKQAENSLEFRGLVSAAICECFQGYGHDGDLHWRVSLIREWWRSRFDLIDHVGEEWCTADSLAQWRTALHGGVEQYLREYAYFVEHGREPLADDHLPELT